MGQEITGNKNREFPDLVPFLLLVLQFLLVVTGRKIIGTDKRGGVDLNGILKPSQTKERTHLLFVNSLHCSTKWANLPPTLISEGGKIGSGKGWLSELCGRRGKLFCVTAPNGKVLSSTRRKGLGLSFRPVVLYGWLCLGLDDLFGCLGLLNAPEAK